MGIEKDDVEDFVAAFFFRVHKSIRRQSEPPLSEALPKKILDAPIDTTASCLFESYYQCMLEREREREREKERERERERERETIGEHLIQQISERISAFGVSICTFVLVQQVN